MKKIISVIVLSIFILTSCSIDWDDSKDIEIANLKNEIETNKQESNDELFNKKLECSKMSDKAEKWLERYTNSYSTYNSYLVNKENEIGFEKSRSEVLETFYSENISSCVSVLQVAYNMDMSWSYKYILFDIIEKKEIGSYYNDEYYYAYINKYGTGDYKWDDSTFPSACDEDSETSHCKAYFNKLKELKN